MGTVNYYNYKRVCIISCYASKASLISVTEAPTYYNRVLNIKKWTEMSVINKPPSHFSQEKQLSGLRVKVF